MPELDLTKPGVAKKVAAEILADIDRASVELFQDGHRKHLGASLIGDSCYRKLWFNFRWVYNKPHDGRLLRLFNRGHLEEKRLTEYLTKAGYDVRPLDPATGLQWRVNGIGGHYGGSQDGEIVLPAKFNYSKPLLLEYKTSGTGYAFDKLQKSGVLIGKPIHSDQMDTYGYLKNYDFSLYCSVNKNDDSIHTEIVKLDKERGKKLEDKARVIILTQIPPPRIAENLSAQDCKICDFKEVCHYRQPIEKNCRSCINAAPRDNKEWFCGKWNAPIPESEIPKGCNDWSAIYKA